MGVTGCVIVRMGVDLGIYQIFRDLGLDQIFSDLGEIKVNVCFLRNSKLRSRRATAGTVWG